MCVCARASATADKIAAAHTVLCSIIALQIRFPGRLVYRQQIMGTISACNVIFLSRWPQKCSAQRERICSCSFTMLCIRVHHHHHHWKFLVRHYTPCLKKCHLFNNLLYTLCFITKTTPYLIAHNLGKC